MSGSGQDRDEHPASGIVVSPRPRRRWGRRVLLAAGAMVGVPLLAGGGVLLAMLAGPVDVTPLVHLFLPVTVEGGGHGQPPRGRLDVGHAQLRWNSLRDGLTSPVLLELTDVRILDAQNRVADSLASGAIALDALPLFRGGLSLTDLRVTGAQIALRRDAQGNIDLDLPGEASGKGGGFPPIGIKHLRRLVLAQTHMVLRDDVTGQVWTVDPVDADLTPVVVKRRHGLSGALTLGMTGAPADSATSVLPVSLHLSARGELSADQALHWHVTLDPVTPAGFVSLAPELKKVQAPIGLDADVILQAGKRAWYMMPREAVAHIALGTGEIRAAGSTLYPQNGQATLHMTLGEQTKAGWPAHLSLDSFAVQLRPPPQPVVVPVAQEGSVQSATTSFAASASTPSSNETPLPPPVLTATGAVDWRDLAVPGAMTGTLDTGLSDVPFDRVADYWPAKAAKGARRWVSRNITAGTIENVHVRLGIGPDRTGKSPDVVSVSGGLDGKGMDVHWLRPIAPIKGLDAHLEFVDLKTIRIDFAHGYQPTTRTLASVGTTGSGRLEVQPGSMIISDLDKKDQIGTIEIGLNGDLRDHFALLSEQRLHILSKHPLPFDHPRGYGAVHFTLSLPLIASVTTDQMTLNGHAHLTHVHLGNVALQRNVDGGTLDSDVTMHGMTFTGGGVFSHIPADVKGMIDFDRVAPGQAVDHIVTHLHLTPETVAAAGIPVQDHVSGRAELQVDYSVIKQAHDRLALDLNLKQAGIHIPLWSKAPGQPTTVHADLQLEGGNIVSASGIRAQGPDLDVNGEAHLRPGRVPELDVPAFRVGRSTGSATLFLPKRTWEPITVRIRANDLDLSPLVETNTAAEPAGKATTLHVPQAASGKVSGPPQRPWVIDLKADHIYYGRDKRIGGVDAYFDHNGVRIERMRFAMTEPSVAQVDIVPDGNRRKLVADIPDFGQLLDRMGVTDMMVGGHAVFHGHFDDQQPTAPFKGALKLSPFTIRHAPGALLVARSLSIYGWLNSRDHSEFEVQRFEMPVKFADGVLHIRDGRAGNGALGATLEGPVDLDKGTMQLSGTIVPAFAINEIPGEIPGVGHLLAPEKGGGLLAVKFALDGRIDKPAFSVEPLTIFLPGILRNMF
ncbi:hypothetical protein AA0472_1967 [Acetobacter estunensis NRIC 0472]|uniref:AsmA-like C-terminal domain-containing protein n=1 Tax=Acetobacter estunensis TaxID=104097 RepID=A0A967B573_9PROT|nr:AsmA-like C-terminal region-containing protein [Acetobacter estunensis]NHO52451.1 hypothetical protein [Acetobacter estunensis]GBQ26021.1 hypothetical protein AA0472_1967 [Acetobacter estunensis NRIC 0472]